MDDKQVGGIFPLAVAAVGIFVDVDNYCCYCYYNCYSGYFVVDSVGYENGMDWDYYHDDDDYVSVERMGDIGIDIEPDWTEFVLV